VLTWAALASGEPFFLVVAVVVAVMFIFSIFASAAAAKRRQALAAWASAAGLSFDQSRHSEFEDRWEFDCLRRGDHRYAQNVMQGAFAGRPMIAFDYHYETHSTDSKGNRETTNHNFSAVIVECPFPLLPLFIRPEGILDKVAGFFGAEDINFESAEFSRKFFVKSPDKKWAYDVIHARTMEFMLSMPMHSLAFNDRYVIAYRDATFAAPAEFATAANLANGILDRLPEYVVRQQQGQASLPGVQ
jgi:hypothetical protein